MAVLERLRRKVLGVPLDPLNPKTRQHIALVAFLAWVGLGADGLSSSCYGPEEAFKALGGHSHLGLYLALATAATVFIIALAYNQVIELFPTGGGGYRVATKLIGAHAGLVSGSALILDYVLTIAISAASGVDALFSLLPATAGGYKLATELLIVAALAVLNLRGMKESIKVLLPIFLGFFVTHAFLIVYGVLFQAERVPSIIPDTLSETIGLTREHGWIFVAALFLRAYSLGGGTYTGIEAVSNNVQSLAEPRVATGKLTMLYMAASLAFTAGGIILLYLLWAAKPVEGQTLNAVVFGSIIQTFGWGEGGVSTAALSIVLAFEAGLLIVASNTGFLGGPAVLANMAADSWVPHKFRYLSIRLVTQNGILVMGIAALVILLGTSGSVDVLVVLYSINVFLTFSLSLAGLCIYWVKMRGHDARWPWRFALSALGLMVTLSILVVTLAEKFTEGGWVTVLITMLVVGLGLLIQHHYRENRRRIQKFDELFVDQPFGSVTNPPKLDPGAPTAAFIVGGSRGGGLHALLWVKQTFPGHFRNFVFVHARTVDAQSYGGQESLKLFKQEATVSMNYFVNFCNSYGLAARYYLAFGTEPIQDIVTLAEQVARDFPSTIFFTSELIFEDESFLTRALHNQAPNVLQRRLHLEGLQMVILPMKLAT
ncbi:MAG TPA: APC family permease [Burkholderiales bacterium]|nr:APC family permease [Burkholderiales bacterium]